MQFQFVALALGAMASVAAAGETVTVYACPTSSATPTLISGTASSTIASTGVVTAPTSTGSPITYATGAASVNGVSGALGLLVAGGVALLL